MESVAIGRGAVVSAVLLLAACGSSGGYPKNDKEFADRLGEVEIDPIVPINAREAINLRGGHVSGEIVTLADGRRISVSAVSPAGGGPVAEYVLVGAVEPSGAISRVTQVSVSGRAYARAADTGTFTYSGRTVALLGRSGGALARMIGESDLELDLGAGTGTLTSSATGAGRTAAVSGGVTVDLATGALDGNALRLDYVDGFGGLSDVASLDGSLRGANAGFSAVYIPKGLDGAGVVTGLVDR